MSMTPTTLTSTTLTPRMAMSLLTLEEFLQQPNLEQSTNRVIDNLLYCLHQEGN